MTVEAGIDYAWHGLIDRLATLLGERDAKSLRDTRLDAAVQPATRLPAERHLPSVLELGVGDTVAICASIARLQSELRWRQNANYSAAEFLAGYAYCELIGPFGRVRRPDVALGLLLLAPHVTYPEHTHPAAEIYAVVAGRAEWRQGDRVWRARGPGDCVHHASMEPHAMRTAAEPLLAAYLWQDHLLESARLVGASLQ